MLAGRVNRPSSPAAQQSCKPTHKTVDTAMLVFGQTCSESIKYGNDCFHAGTCTPAPGIRFSGEKSNE
jgi:hypothetical protein